MSTTTQFDVVVVGAGPAGTMTAIGLARQGISTAIIERSALSGFRVGETLPPEITPWLNDNELLASFLLTDPVPSLGIQSAWGTSELSTIDFIFNPHGNGWHIDRLKFNCMLIDQAIARGVTFIQKTSVVNAVRTSNAQWTLSARDKLHQQDYTCQFIVDATGIKSRIATLLGDEKLMTENTISISKIVPLQEQETQNQSMLFLESAENGWWYLSPLPRHKAICSFITDKQYFTVRKKQTADVWQAELNNTVHLVTKLKTFDEAFYVCPVGPNRLKNIVGPGWLAVGDACVCLDPLSGGGIFAGLTSAEKAAVSIVDYLNNNVDSLAKYSLQMQTAYNSHLKIRKDYHKKENRWLESSFWKRRCNTG